MAVSTLARPRSTAEVTGPPRRGARAAQTLRHSPLGLLGLGLVLLVIQARRSARC